MATQTNGLHTASALPETFIVSAARTPVGSFNGALKKLTAPQLGVFAVKGALEKAGVRADQIEEVVMGNVLQAGVGQSPARQVVLGSGMPIATEATTINKVCASGLKAVALAAQSIQTGQRNLVVAGGMESMTNAPFIFPRNASFGDQKASDVIMRDGLLDAFDHVPMGNCAEETAAKHGITREMQDDFAIESYRRAAEAWKAGKFANEVIPVTIPDPRKGDTTIAEDEEYKNIKLDKVRTLKPVFKKEGGTITPANASSINDGASALVLASGEKTNELSLTPLARIISFADGALAPVNFPVAPAQVSIPAALKKAGLKVEDISLWEINEAFSVVVPASAKLLGLDQSKVNVNGGAVALGHPIGGSGSRILTTLTHLLKPGEYGCAAICNGGGGSTAIIIQKL